MTVDPDRIWIDELAARVGHFGLGDWLVACGGRLGAPPPFPPTKSARFVVAGTGAITMRLHDPAWRTNQPVPPDKWVIYDIEMSNVRYLPLGLDADTATPQGAEKILSSETMSDNRSESKFRIPSFTYFLPDRRAVNAIFRPSLVGIDKLRITRLFDWPDWRACTLPKAPSPL